MKCIGVMAVSASASGFAVAAIAKSNVADETVLRQQPAVALHHQPRAPERSGVSAPLSAESPIIPA